MTIRAKFMVTGLNYSTYGVAQPIYPTVVMQPVYDTSIEVDRRFFDATPSGKLEMQVNNVAALNQLKLGTTFYVDFTPVGE